MERVKEKAREIGEVSKIEKKKERKRKRNTRGRKEDGRKEKVCEGFEDRKRENRDKGRRRKIMIKRMKKNKEERGIKGYRLTEVEKR